MRRRLAVIILGLFAWTVAVLAHDDFGDDDHYYDMEEAERQYVISQPRVATLAPTPPSPAPSPETQPAPLPAGVEELPFELLGSDVDRDRDGLSDLDEARLATDPADPDTDGDGFIDGLEVVRGYNPLAASPGDRVEYSGVNTADTSTRYRVINVRLEQKEGGQERLVVTGTAPAYSLVTLLVYSKQPEAWVARADASGRFLYNSEDTLENGDHTVYAAATAAGGEVLTAGRPVKFKRTASEVRILRSSPRARVSPSPAAQAARADLGGLITVGIAVAVVILVSAAAGAGYVWWRRLGQKGSLTGKSAAREPVKRSSRAASFGAGTRRPEADKPAPFSAPVPEAGREEAASKEYTDEKELGRSEKKS